MNLPDKKGPLIMTISILNIIISLSCY